MSTFSLLFQYIKPQNAMFSGFWGERGEIHETRQRRSNDCRHTSINHGTSFRSRLKPQKAAQNKKAAVSAAFVYASGIAAVMAEAVGFEPTCHVRDKTISSRSRYDHFDTLPDIPFDFSR